MDQSGDLLHDLYLRMRVLDREISAARSAGRKGKRNGTWWERFFLLVAISSLLSELF